MLLQHTRNRLMLAAALIISLWSGGWSVAFAQTQFSNISTNTNKSTTEQILPAIKKVISLNDIRAVKIDGAAFLEIIQGDVAQLTIIATEDTMPFVTVTRRKKRIELQLKSFISKQAGFSNEDFESGHEQHQERQIASRDNHHFNDQPRAHFILQLPEVDYIRSTDAQIEMASLQGAKLKMDFRGATKFKSGSLNVENLNIETHQKSTIHNNHISSRLLQIKSDDNSRLTLGQVLTTKASFKTRRMSQLELTTLEAENTYVATEHQSRLRIFKPSNSHTLNLTAKQDSELSISQVSASTTHVAGYNQAQISIREQGVLTGSIKHKAVLYVDGQQPEFNYVSANDPKRSILISGKSKELVHE